MNHTKGPWSIHSRRVRGQHADGDVAHVLTVDQNVAEANARLIAAAPEMLEAFQQIAQLVTDVINFPNAPDTKNKIALVGNIALRAIAKAEGGES